MTRPTSLATGSICRMKCSSSVARAPMGKPPWPAGKTWSCLCTSFAWTPLCVWRPSWWERIECCCVLTILIAFILASYSTLIVNCHPGADAVWCVVGLELFTMGLARFIFAAEHVVDFSCYVWCSSCLLLVCVVAWIIMAFASSFICCVFDLALAFFAYRRPAEIYSSSVCTFSCWFPSGSVDGIVNEFVEAFVLSQERDTSGALGEDNAFFARYIICWSALTDRCTTNDAVGHMCPSQLTDSEIFNLPSAFLAVLHT